MNLGIKRDAIARGLENFKAVAAPSLPADLRKGIDDTLSFVSGDPKEPRQLLEFLPLLRQTLEGLDRLKGLRVENQQAFDASKDQLVHALTELERGVSDALGNYIKVQHKLSKLAIGSLGGKKALIVGIMLLVAIVLVGAGIPIALNLMKRSNASQAAVPTTISVPLVPSQGFDVQSPGGTAPVPTQYATSNSICTYTLLMNIGSLEPQASSATAAAGAATAAAGAATAAPAHVLFARTTQADTSLGSPVMRVRLDENVNRAFVEFALKAPASPESTFCTFTVEDVPMYRWFVMQIVYNNTAAYRVANVYIDGQLVKLCHLFLCPSALMDHNGDTVVFGKELPSGNAMSNVAFKYFKYASYTMQPDELASEATKLLGDINAQEKQTLASLNKCSAVGGASKGH